MGERQVFPVQTNKIVFIPSRRHKTGIPAVDGQRLNTLGYDFL